MVNSAKTPQCLTIVNSVKPRDVLHVSAAIIPQAMYQQQTVSLPDHVVNDCVYGSCCIHTALCDGLYNAYGHSV